MVAPAPSRRRRKRPEVDYQRLQNARRYSMKQLEPFRENRRRLMKEYLGSGFGPRGSTDEQPINMLEATVTTYLASLMPGQPRVLVSTPHAGLRPMANEFQLALDLAAEELGLREVFSQVIIDAMFSLGILKVGLVEGRQIEWEGALHEIGRPAVDRIDLDDFVWDMGAKKIEQCAFIGHRFRVPLREVEESGLYDRREVKKLRGSRGHRHISDGSWGERVEDLGRTDRGFSESGERDLEPMVELWDFWLPRHGKVCTMSDDAGAIRPLRSEDWEGPTTGPYHFLRFGAVPSQLMPLAPLINLAPLNRSLNHSARKLIRQAKRLKSITLLDRGTTSESQEINRASDGQSVGVSRPDGAREMVMGGPNQVLMQFLVALRQLYSQMAGNLDSLAGLGVSAETATQEKLIHQSSSQRVNSMGQTVSDWIRAVMTNLAWWIWSDPGTERELVQHVKELDASVPLIWSWDTREGDYWDYNFELDPHSRTDEGPGARANKLMMLVERLLMPLAPVFESQGIVINAEGLVRSFSRLSGVDELEEILTFTEQPAADRQGPSGEPTAPRMPQTSSRNYNYQSRGNSTPQAADAALLQSIGGMQKAGDANGGGGMTMPGGMA